MTLQIQFLLQMQLDVDGKLVDLSDVLALLEHIEQQGNLRLAANACGFSYRKAWDRIKDMEKVLSGELVHMRRGKGTQLTALGRKLIQIDRQNHQTLQSTLQTVALKANAELQELLPFRQPIKIIASDSILLNRLREQYPVLSLSIEGSQQALLAYAEERCDIAGFHIAACMVNQALIDKLRQYFDPETDQFVLLEQRQQGLISRPEKPIDSLRQMIDASLRFVNRQQGSGTRLLLDYLLSQQQVSAEQVRGYHHEEHTHLAVASLVLSGQAEVGLGIEAVARQLGLHFSPISREYYFLVYKTSRSDIRQVLSFVKQLTSVDEMDYARFFKSIQENR